MTAKPKPQARRKINCQYLELQADSIRFVRQIEGEFTCPRCGSVLRQGRVFYCEICASELGPCCHPFSSDHPNHRIDVSGDLWDYLPPITCDREGCVRCMCCNRMVCVRHARKADLSRLELEEGLGHAVLCPSCKETLDPPDDDPLQYSVRFDDEDELERFLRHVER